MLWDEEVKYGRKEEGGGGRQGGVKDGEGAGERKRHLTPAHSQMSCYIAGEE